MIKKLSVIIFLFFAICSFGQEAFTDQELHDFVALYFKQKKTAYFFELRVEVLLEEYDISKERYGEIVKSIIKNDRIELSNREDDLLQEIKSQNQAIGQAKDQPELKPGDKISSIRYHEILLKYKNDIVFQRSLKPYFDAYINAKR